MPINHGLDGYLDLAELVSVVEYNGSLIILKQKNDEFIFLSEEQSEFVRRIWSKNISQFDQEEFLVVTELQSIGLVSEVLRLSPSELLSDEKKSKGLFDTRWSESDFSFDFRSFRPFYFFKSLMILILVKSVSEKQRLLTIVSSLKSQVPCHPKHDENELLVIAKNVNLAMKLSIREVKCLEFAYAVCKIAMAEKIHCVFRVGVQTHPFMSHAWVECLSGVVLDRSDLPSELAIIVSVGDKGND